MYEKNSHTEGIGTHFFNSNILTILVYITPILRSAFFHILVELRWYIFRKFIKNIFKKIFGRPSL